MILHSHSWAYIWRNSNLKRCLHHYVQWPRHGSNVNVHWQRNGSVCVCIYIYILLSHKNDWKQATDTFATTCMDLEIIRLRGLSQRKTNITSYHLYDGGFPGGASSEEPTCWCRRHKRWGFDPWVGKIPWRRACNPLQYSCLENPMDRGAWWVMVHKFTKSQMSYDITYIVCGI